MNVREEILREKIDPFLTTERLSAVAQLALAETGGGAGKLNVETVKVLSGGCWNRVIGVSFSSGEAQIVCKISPEDR